jgi:hypothetical protein
MTFINNFFLKPKIRLTYNNLDYVNINMDNNMDNNIDNINNFYNPIIGSNLGIPLNLLQLIYTSEYYNHNIINFDLIALQFAIGIFTYGTDRLVDALEYNNYKNNDLISKNLTAIYSYDKINYYEFLIKNLNANIFIIFLSYSYIFYLLGQNIETIPFLLLLTSTIKYKDFKKNYGELKPFYIGLFWTIGTVILPCVLYDHNYEILNYPTIYGASFLSMFGASNLLDIKDIDEDKAENIKTLPVKYGSNLSLGLSHISILAAIFLFTLNDNFYENIWLSSLFEIQNFGQFFLYYNKKI